MNKRHFFLIIIGLLLATSVGCNTNQCGQRMTFREWFSNRPRPLQNLFTRGDDCNNCNTPAGQLEMGGFDCQDGNCMSGGLPAMSGSNLGYYPSDISATAGTMVPESRARSGYAPAFTPNRSNEVGSGVQSFNSNAELELPPMYGRQN